MANGETGLPALKSSSQWVGMQKRNLVIARMSLSEIQGAHFLETGFGVGVFYH